MSWLHTLGFLGHLNSASTMVSSTEIHEPVLEWRINVVPNLTNATSVQYSGVTRYNELLYLGTSNRSGILMVDQRYGVKVGRLDTAAPVQAKPTILQSAKGDRLLTVDLSGEVSCWSLPVPPANTIDILPIQIPNLERPTSDRSAEHQLQWSVSLDIPTNTPIETDGTYLFVSTNNDVVYALDLDGNIMWRFAHRVSPGRKGNLQLFGGGHPLVEEQSIVVGFSDGAVLRLSKADGSVMEKVYNGEGRYPDVIAQPTVVQGGLVISGFEQPSYKEQNEQVLWSKEFGAVQGALVDAKQGNGTLVYHAGSDGVLRKVDTTSGSVIWEWDSETGSALTAPVWWNEQLLIASHVGGLYVVDPMSGLKSWQSRFDYRQTGYMQPPLVSDCTIHVLSAKGFLEQYSTCSSKVKDQKMSITLP